MANGDVEADHLEGILYAPPNFPTRHADIFATEGDIIADASENYLRVGVLEDQADLTLGVARLGAVHAQSTALLALFVAAEHASQRVQQRRFSRTGCTEQENPLARLDAEGQLAHRPAPPTGMAPTPVAGVDGCTSPRRAHQHPLA
ncbi:hypothetical protein CLE01_28070 [Cryobacterium levicorallinum]|nr:hypothetical protein CLE01_28070 [Cryobacterium levicorallinum]